MKWLFVILIFNLVCSQQTNNFEIQRKKMVEDQIQKRGVRDRSVLSAMARVEREKFVPEQFRDMAYSDGPLPIGYKQTISQPYIVAYMTEKLQVDSNHKVLEIGTGSGYQAAILGELSDKVFTIEIIPELGKSSIDILQKLNYNNIFVRIGDGYKGWPEEAPFDRIIVTAAPGKIPEKLVEQLANGGQMIIPVGESVFSQYLWIIKKDNKGNIGKEKILPVRFVPMVKE
ncbi:MAG: protein-L-isoaspartate O-methyltransferase [Candidatus Marinimicrobia bacterium]|nr:protein-L-isoaspartate O-methyltransferase [Candidatus Neomarinimicrobiota bacterium]